MAAGTIITVLSNIPWGQVVENAPKVADGAAKLWNAVANRKKSKLNDESSEGDEKIAQLSEREVVQQRLAALEESVRNLQDQMRSSTELVKILAEQNTLLVQRVDLSHQKLIRLSIASGTIGVLLLGMLIYIMIR